MMRCLVVYAVVERIAHYPVSLRFMARLDRSQKRVVDGQKRCNITRGYVAQSSG